ncbi:MAG TPA: hypothetical protein VKE70_01185, partial [Candidatus Solibacter sp.]|nr:hypothetical protein [Candidatus Solibacter sp.]
MLRSGVFENRLATDLNKRRNTNERQATGRCTLKMAWIKKGPWSGGTTMRKNKVGAIVIKCLVLLVVGT